MNISWYNNYTVHIKVEKRTTHTVQVNTESIKWHATYKRAHMVSLTVDCSPL